jgi:hypothetical protein
MFEMRVRSDYHQQQFFRRTCSCGLYPVANAHIRSFRIRVPQNHVDDPLLVKRLDRMLELKACLHQKEFGKPRRLLGGELSTDDVPLKKKKKRKTKSMKDSSSSTPLSPATTKKKKKVPKKSTKKVTFLPELDQST